MSSPSSDAPAPSCASPFTTSLMDEAACLAAAMVDDCMKGYLPAANPATIATTSNNSTSKDSHPDDMMRMMSSMDDLLEDVVGRGNGVPCTAGSNLATHPLTTTLIESSMVTGTTDLFEGDLCDDELDDIPSLYMPNGCPGGSFHNENLQLLCPAELVDEVQEQVAREAVTAGTNRSAVPPSLPNPKANLNSLATKKPVVNFLVQKLSDAEAVGDHKKRPASALVMPSASSRKAKKNRDDVLLTDKVTSSSDRSSTKAAAEKPTVTTRITRSRAKQCSSPTREGTPPTDVSTNTSNADVSVTKASRSSRSDALPVHKEPAVVFRSGFAFLDTKDRTKLSVSTDTLHDNGEKMDAGTASPTDEVIAQGNTRGMPIVTPVETKQKTVSTKQLSVQEKMQDSVGSIALPALYTNMTSKTGSSEPPTCQRNVTSSRETAARDPLLKNADACATGLAQTQKSVTAATLSRRSSRRVSGTANTDAIAKETSFTEAPVPVDTSTAHIQALTADNGASVCLSLHSCTLLASSLDAEEKATTNSGKAKNITVAESKATEASPTAQTPSTPIPTSSPMTDEERAQQSRNRNRKHARNTRLRKKAYVEELKQTLNELVLQRDRARAAQERNRQREADQREVRFRVMDEFLKLRGRNEADGSLWAAIMMPTFVLTLPQTPFQEMVENTAAASRIQTLNGVEQVMCDSSYFAAFLQSLGSSKRIQPENEPEPIRVSLVYCCDRKEFMMDGCNAVLEWNALSLGAIAKGAPAELNFRGSLRATFCPDSNRLRSMDLVFDTGTILKQSDELGRYR